MFRRSSIPPDAVHRTLRQHLLVDGYPIVIDFENSRRSRVRDAITGRDYLDFFSFFASNPLGFNHPGMQDADVVERLGRVATTKVSNSDYYTTYMAEFVDTLGSRSDSSMPFDSWPRMMPFSSWTPVPGMYVPTGAKTPVMPVRAFGAPQTTWIGAPAP